MLFKNRCGLPFGLGSPRTGVVYLLAFVHLGGRIPPAKWKPSLLSSTLEFRQRSWFLRAQNICTQYEPRSPSIALLPLFGWASSPTKIDYRKMDGILTSLLDLGDHDISNLKRLTEKDSALAGATWHQPPDSKYPAFF